MLRPHTGSLLHLGPSLSVTHAEGFVIVTSTRCSREVFVSNSTSLPGSLSILFICGSPTSRVRGFAVGFCVRWCSAGPSNVRQAYSPACAHFCPFLFSVFFLGFMRWSSVFWCFLSFCLLYVLCPIFWTIFGLHFGILWGNFVFQHLQYITKSTIFLVSVSSRFIAPYSCFENAVCSRNILISLERFIAC